MFVDIGWGCQGSRHGRFQWFRIGLISYGLPAAVVGSTANAVAGGSASAHLCVIASGAGQNSTIGWQGQVDEASVFY